MGNIFFDNINIDEELSQGAFGHFYYINGRFPADNNLINVAKGIIPHFIQTNNEVLPFYLCQKILPGISRCLVLIEFLCAFNVQLGGDLNRPRCNERILS